MPEEDDRKPEPPAAVDGFVRLRFTHPIDYGEVVTWVHPDEIRAILEEGHCTQVDDASCEVRFCGGHYPQQTVDGTCDQIREAVRLARAQIRGGAAGDGGR